MSYGISQDKPRDERQIVALSSRPLAGMSATCTRRKSPPERELYLRIEAALPVV